jgi:hypothetical protein
MEEKGHRSVETVDIDRCSVFSQALIKEERFTVSRKRSKVRTVGAERGRLSYLSDPTPCRLSGR